MTAGDLTAAAKTLALECGFARVGIAPVHCDWHNEVFQRWLDDGWHADMAYLKRNSTVRKTPALALDSAVSVICLLVSYAPRQDQGVGHVARYARGRDYHRVLKGRCHRLMDRLRQVDPAFEGRAFVDAAPLPERSLAAAAGLGWIGANGCLVAPGLGSYVLLAEIVCNLPLTPDAPIASGCDECRACVDACPSAAIAQGARVDARRCLSYHTIENRGKIPEEYWPAMAGRLFGCDRCQEVCPHNRDVPPGDPELIDPGPEVSLATPTQVLTWQESHWDTATRASAVRRANVVMLTRNAVLSVGAAGDAAAADALQQAAKRFPDLKDEVRWAISQVKSRPHPASD